MSKTEKLPILGHFRGPGTPVFFQPPRHAIRRWKGHGTFYHVLKICSSKVHLSRERWVWKFLTKMQKKWQKCRPPKIFRGRGARVGCLVDYGRDHELWPTKLSGLAALPGLSKNVKIWGGGLPNFWEIWTKVQTFNPNISSPNWFWGAILVWGDGGPKALLKFQNWGTWPPPPILGEFFFQIFGFSTLTPKMSNYMFQIFF